MRSRLHFHRFPLAAALCLVLAPSAAAQYAIRWTGNAQDVAEVTTVAVSGTWATADKARLEINNKVLEVTIGSATTMANVAAALAAAVDAADATTDLAGDESRNFGGEEIPEFAEVDAAANGSTLTLTSHTPGVPFEVSVSETTAGSGALGAPTETVAATGKNWYDNGDNWVGGVVPGVGDPDDSAVFDYGSVDCLYGLDYPRTNTKHTSVTITGDYTGQIGRPPLRAVGAASYLDYRAHRYLEMYSDDYANDTTLTIKEGTLGIGVGHGSLRVDAQDQKLDSITVSESRGADTTTPNILLAGGDVQELNITKGAVQLDPPEANVGDASAVVPSTSFSAGRNDSTATSCYVVCGDKTDFASVDAMVVRGGTLTFNGPITKASGTPVLDIHGGTVTAARGCGARTTTVHAGTLYVRSGSNTKLVAYEGTISFASAKSDLTVTSVVLYPGATYLDPDGRGGSVINLVAANTQDVSLVIPRNKKLTLSTASP